MITGNGIAILSRFGSDCCELARIGQCSALVSLELKSDDVAVYCCEFCEEHSKSPILLDVRITLSRDLLHNVSRTSLHCEIVILTPGLKTVSVPLPWVMCMQL
ncbi:hypothetical protein scyTo_0003121 [Scyliorhinus torazame]|uniref:Uncharacterized protein n=1 Tax=Scyliorhinus torazame TaxID=75743 RepID=A0A401PLN4_SCYTO|nr:hypothetical protein [Scyliorhinus torazame]